MLLEIPKYVDLCEINRVKSVKISFVRANDLISLNDDGVQFVSQITMIPKTTPISCTKNPVA